MDAPRSRLLELDDELLEQILSEVQELQPVANACRRLCKLVRLLHRLQKNRRSTGPAVASNSMSSSQQQQQWC
jgi:hypothetical protein